MIAGKAENSVCGFMCIAHSTQHTAHSTPANADKAVMLNAHTIYLFIINFVEGKITIKCCIDDFNSFVISLN